MVYYLVQPITTPPFIKLLMMRYCVPVLVSLGCIQFEVLLIVIVAERMLVCSMMGNANVVPAEYETNKCKAIVCKYGLQIKCRLCMCE